MPPFVIGISGATRAGKTTLASGLCKRICGTDATHEPRLGKKDKVSRFKSARGTRVSLVSQDSYFLASTHNDECDRWDLPESLDHGAISEALCGEIQNDYIHCVIFEGFKAFYDENILHYFDLLLWIEVSYDISCKRRLKTKRCSREQFETYIWPNHLKYQRTVSDHEYRLGVEMYRLSGMETPLTTLEAALNHVKASSRLLADAIRATEAAEAATKLQLCRKTYGMALAGDAVAEVVNNGERSNAVARLVYDTSAAARARSRSPPRAVPTIELELASDSEASTPPLVNSDEEDGEEQVSMQHVKEELAAEEDALEDAFEDEDVQPAKPQTVSGVEISMLDEMTPIIFSLEKSSIFHENASWLLQTALASEHKAADLYKICETERSVSDICRRLMPELHESHAVVVQLKELQHVSAVGCGGKRSILLALVVAVALQIKESHPRLQLSICGQYKELKQPLEHLLHVARQLGKRATVASKGQACAVVAYECPPFLLPPPSPTPPPPEVAGATQVNRATAKKRPRPQSGDPPTKRFEERASAESRTSQELDELLRLREENAELRARCNLQAEASEFAVNDAAQQREPSSCKDWFRRPAGSRASYGQARSGRIGAPLGSVHIPMAEGTW